jgi:protein-L-isoaspartate(D-aspartate) O-methyltransferase
MTDYTAARNNMVENQLRPNRIEDPRLLAAMREIPREEFCPHHLRGVAYSDETIEVGPGRYLIEPLALGWMLQAAQVRPQDVALVIGCGTGYVAAVLARLAATVFLLVPDAAAARDGEALMEETGCDNVVVQVGPTAKGLPDQAPFDVILLAGAVPSIPQSLLDQLGEGGRLVAVVGDGRFGKVTVCTKVGSAVGRLTPYDAGIPPLADLRPRPTFEF